MDFETLSLIGSALISCQKVEFMTYGLISHFKNIQHEKKFRKLSPQVFLDDSAESKEIRKHTLGQLFKLLKDKNVAYIHDRLDDYLTKRNILIHELLREFYKDNNNEINDSRVKEFCIEIIETSNKLEKFFKGFLYQLTLFSMENTDFKLPKEIGEIANEYNYFLNCILKEDLI